MPKKSCKGEMQSLTTYYYDRMMQTSGHL